MEDDDIRAHVGAEFWPKCPCFQMPGGDACSRLYEMSTEYAQSFAQDAGEAGFCPEAMPNLIALFVDMMMTRVASAIVAGNHPGITEITPSLSLEMSDHKGHLYVKLRESLAGLEHRSNVQCALNAGGSRIVQ